MERGQVSVSNEELQRDWLGFLQEEPGLSGNTFRVAPLYFPGCGVVRLPKSWTRKQRKAYRARVLALGAYPNPIGWVMRHHR